jgi:uncharacterized protein (DUF2252 family)
VSNSTSPPKTETKKTADADALKPVQHLTLAERAARGKAAREQVARGEHAGWEPASDRPDPVDLLEEQGASRVPELVPIRYGRMLVSPFTFYRGAAYLMASDLAQGPRTKIRVQLCGDAHLSNFGGYSAPDRRLVFDINDFDETLPGPFEWDIKRLATSFEVAGRSRGFDDATRAEINREVTRSYRQSMASFSTMRTMDVWYTRIDVEDLMRVSQGLSATAIKRFEKNVAKARAKDSMSAFAKLTEVADGEPRFISNPPLIVPASELYGASTAEVIDRMRVFIRGYRRTLQNDRQHLLEQFRFVDLARKVVGVGSVGTRAWIALFIGRDGSDPLILQIKEAQTSVLEPFVGKSGFANHGQRVVEGQRLMQAASDLMLGWLHATGVDGVERDFYVRQLWDSKGSAQVDVLEPRAMTVYAQVCGETLARAHARSGDAIEISSYLGNGTSFDKAIAAFAHAYADQNERDYEALKEAADSGRIEVQTGL